ncbi:hypothetical protein EXN66_Car004339 [Channa argus]|uniref:Uncharacterized protein n=1 Tax=Channa argus TaxID=215402 RepID=A0A6G1PEK2_CHAAH|nr:hypothetical protein EXN66_Car004339 [Channa argus]
MGQGEGEGEGVGCIQEEADNLPDTTAMPEGAEYRREQRLERESGEAGGGNCCLAERWEEDVETRANQGTAEGQSGEAGGRLAIGYSQDYFHMVQCPLVMSRTVMAWLPPPQHHPFNPRLSGETVETQ